MRYLVVLAAAFIFWAPFAKADILFQKNGDEITGQFLGVKDDNILFKVSTATVKFPADKAIKVKFLPVKTHGGFEPEIEALLKEDLGKPKYNGHRHITVFHETLIEIKSAAQTVRTERVMQKILEPVSKDIVANGKFYYLEGFETPKLNYALSLNNGVISFADETIMQKGSEYLSAPEYNRLKSLRFSIPMADVHSITDYSYTVTSGNRDSYPSFSRVQFNSYELIRLRRVKVIAPKELKINYKYNGELDVAFSSYTQNGNNVYVWQMENVPAKSVIADMPSSEAVLDSLLVAPAQQWQNVLYAVGGYIGQMLEENREFLKGFADLIVKENDSGEEKIKKLYSHITKSVVFRNLPATDYGWEFTDPKTVLTRMSGNAVDKPLILYLLLKALDIDARFLLINPSNGYPFAENIPSLAQFPLGAVVAGGKLLFPYGRYTDFGDIIAEANEAYALDITLGKLVKLPPVNAEKNALLWKVRALLDKEGKLTVAEELLPKGVYNLSWREFESFTRSETDILMHSIINSFNPNAEIADYNFENLSDLSAQTKVSTNYTVENYPISAGGKYMAFMLPVQPKEYSPVTATAREYPLYYGLPFYEETNLELKLPDNYGVYYMPSGLQINTKCLSYSAAYKLDKRTLTYTDSFKRNCSQISVEDYKDYRNAVLQISQFMRNYVVLRGNGK